MWGLIFALLTLHPAWLVFYITYDEIDPQWLSHVFQVAHQSAELAIC
jgi:hypothetical protein